MTTEFVKRADVVGLLRQVIGSVGNLPGAFSGMIPTADPNDPDTPYLHALAVSQHSPGVADELNSSDIQLLRFCNGEDIPEIDGWKPWMPERLDLLIDRGLVDSKPTERGIEYITNDAGRALLSGGDNGTR